MDQNSKTPTKVTIERVKQTKGYEHLSDQEAQDIIDSYKQFAYMTYELFNKVPEHEQKQFIRSI